MFLGMPTPLMGGKKAQVEYISAANGGTTVTLPPLEAGDLILLIASREGSGTPPVLPAGYTTLVGDGVVGFASSVGYRFADGSETSSGIISGTTVSIAAIYRHVADVGAAAVASGTSFDVTVPGLTLESSRAQVAAVLTNRAGALASLSTPFAGMVTRHILDSTQMVVLQDTDGTVSSWTAKTRTLEDDQGWVNFAVELIPA